MPSELALAESMERKVWAACRGHGADAGTVVAPEGAVVVVTAREEVLAAGAGFEPDGLLPDARPPDEEQAAAVPSPATNAMAVLDTVVTLARPDTPESYPAGPAGMRGGADWSIGAGTGEMMDMVAR